ncbi:hypothetical protein CpB0575 [Chlamydia pneumoniae TW-183]|uniref:Uncharacterized protein n=1 Tax=Chlamydia pneumoniae TaxID=83558 RepID=A0ABN3YQ26_CHLPN|nr:hypothetical protein CpB0575 [Chlamydia pneumoniae TW-183]
MLARAYFQMKRERILLEFKKMLSFSRRTVFLLFKRNFSCNELILTYLFGEKNFVLGFS